MNLNNKYIENVDYTIENGLFVWTSHFLLQRGYCCNNGCKNCPYRKESKDKQKDI